MRAILIFLTVLLSVFSSYSKVKTGIEVLRQQNFKILEGKRVGLITNPTGVDGNLKPTIDILHEASNVNLVALFGPEHGVRGDAYAGDKVENVTDFKTGIPVYSLYGKIRKPTPEMMRNIDVLVYDIQDVGCRSYTYISTMGLAMEAASENNIDFVVLDRPNPLGGQKIEGNLTETSFISFVSQFKIPYIYGLTCGELALMLNEEKMLANQCRLTVIKMKGWKRSMNWEQTGLEWVIASPHIPHKHSSFFYPLTGILGELYYVSVGVGYTLPFQIVGAPWIDAEMLTSNLNALRIPGIVFRPIHFKPFYSVHKDEICHGVQMHISNYKKVPLSDIQFYIMQEMYKLYPEKAVFKNASSDRFSMFDKVCGTNMIRKEFAENYQFKDVKTYWYKDVEEFHKLSSKYYLYK